MAVRFLFHRTYRTAVRNNKPCMLLVRTAEKHAPMPRCDTCGNEYDKSFEVRMAGSTHTFDSFECAIHKLAPACAHCQCRIIGHGVEAGGRMFCCANCARHSGEEGLKDRVKHPVS
jgi:hypothetical protein